ncbi:MAG: tRNA-uridine aminocarboxypropyltransferase [Neptuniibacter sp.]
MSKPFLARGSNVVRCPVCLLASRVCICSYKLSYKASARFLLLMHHNEGFKPTNTGRLIEDSIAGTEKFKWSRTEPDEAFLQAIVCPQVDPYIVFPSGQGYEDRMVQFERQSGKEPVFIILDGTWRQARRMFRLSRYLDQIPVIEPDVQVTSQYKLRKASVDGQLCTAEVAAEMLRTVGDQQGAELLHAYFQVFNEHYRAARLTRPLQEETAAKRLLRDYLKSV